MERFKSTVLGPELLAKIKKLHFYTRHLASQGVGGQYRSAFRGRGIEFEEVREYLPGDDVRAIDWKVTARSQKPYIKSYREERELTVMIAVDVSASTRTATRNQLRENLIAQFGAVLTLIALQNNDKVGLVTYSDEVETYHPPRKARGAVWRILHEVLTPGTYKPQTDLGGLCGFLRRVLKRSSIVFIISDFFASNYERELAALSKRHDVTGVIVSDPADIILPKASLVNVRNPETGKTILVDTASPRVAEYYQQHSHSARAERERLFQKYRIGEVNLQTDQAFIDELKRYFESRSKGSAPKRSQR